MHIRLRCFGTLAGRLGERRVVELPGPGTIMDLLRVLGVEDGKDVSVIMLNGRQARATEPVADGDEVMLVPPVIGGCTC